jgi:hypothetical protein
VAPLGAKGGNTSCAGVWQDGKFELKLFTYPVEATVEKPKALAFPRDVEAELLNILVTGSV